MNCQKARSLSPSLLAALAAALLIRPAVSQGEESFMGTLSYLVKASSMDVPIRFYSNGKQTRTEFGRPGKPSRIWLIGLEEFEGVVNLNTFKKTYTVAANEPPPMRGWKDELEREQKRKLGEWEYSDPEETEIMDLPCLKYILKSKGPDTEVWIMENNSGFPIASLSVWSDMDFILPVIHDLLDKKNALPIKIMQKNWRGKATFSMQLEKVEGGPPDPDLFVIPDGYRQAG